MAAAAEAEAAKPSVGPSQMLGALASLPSPPVRSRHGGRFIPPNSVYISSFSHLLTISGTIKCKFECPKFGRKMDDFARQDKSRKY